MKIEAGDLLFIKGDCYASPLIRFFLKSDYTHVTIATDEEHICEVDLFTKMKIMKNPYSEYDVYRLEPTLNEVQKKNVLVFLRKKCSTSKGYDWWRIISLFLQKYFRLNLIIHAQDRYICSEIIDKAYQHIGIDLVDHKVTGDVTPLDLMNSIYMKHLFTYNEGKTVIDISEKENFNL
ncbi:hypothetical protein [Bacillus sp. 165]|uniref:hypothetical protein n=1 Tax=Bacillus sp. 165 TaxID=1529117 RepID=UPI001ADD46F3|nr:hypothetical protein [Bacillus sp. 165]MBO9130809.1 hypothetical protein [Bacillus sp. 165]